MKKLQWTTVQRSVNDLVPQEINPRKMSDKQMSPFKGYFGTLLVRAVDGDPLAWLSELTKQRDYIKSSIQNLGLVMVE